MMLQTYLRTYFLMLLISSCQSVSSSLLKNTTVVERPSLKATVSAFTEEKKNYNTKGKPPPAADSDLYHALHLHSALKNSKVAQDHVPSHHSVQRGRKPRTIDPQTSTTLEVSNVTNTASGNGNNTGPQRPALELNSRAKRNGTGVNTTVHPKGHHSVLLSKEHYKKMTVRPTQFGGVSSNQVKIHDLSVRRNLSAPHKIENGTGSRVSIASIFTFSGRNFHELVRKRANNAVWAMGCLGMLLILLFSAICYTRLWSKRYGGSWIDNLDPKHHLQQEDDVQEVMKSRARFLPMFTNRKHKYSRLPTRDMDTVSNTASMDSIEEEWESDENEDYKPLL